MNDSTQQQQPLEDVLQQCGYDEGEVDALHADSIVQS